MLRKLLRPFAIALAVALVAAACGGDEEEDAAAPPPPPPAEEPAAPPEAPPAPPAEAGGPSDAPGGPFTLNVGGAGYAMPGPSGGILGGLPPDLVFPWTYNFDTATFDAGSSPAAPFDPSIRTASQDYEIAWVSGWAALEFSQYIANSIKSTAAASGVHVGAICDSEFDPEKALACAETVAESDPDAVIFGNWRSEAAESSMEVFDDAGIPVITIDVWHPNAIFFGANNYVSGALAGVNTGLYALETWNCEGIEVLLAQNLSAGEAPDLRTSGFADGVQAVCGGDVPVSKIDVDGSPENGFVSTTDWLTGNPGAEHVLATSLDDVVAVPMSRAMEQAGRSGVAAGHGSEPNGVERLNEGPASETRYLGSVAYFPELYGVYAVAALIDILDGRAVPQEIHIDHVWVNRDNVDQYYDPEGQPIHTLGPSAPAGGPSDAPGGPFTLNVGGAGYAMPGPSGGILGGLPPDLVFPWTYNFDTATFDAGSSPAAPFDPSIRTASQDYEIAWVSGWAALEFSQYIANSIKSTAAASGVHVGAICDSEFDPEKALACAETVAESDPDAVIFGNWRSEAAESSMEVFDDAGIPVITIDVWHPNAIFFGANNYVSGALAGVNTGLYALETWNCEGIEVLLAQNLSAGEAPDLRTSGFADGVQAVCGGDVPVSKIDVDGSPENGFVSTTDWLTGNPGAEHVLATSLDDVVAVPMSRAMEQAGRSGVAAGHGSEPNGVERLNEDSVSETRYLGSVAYFPELYGVYAVAALIDILDGRAVPQEIHIDHVWVNRDNVDQYYDPEGQPIHNLGP